MPIPAPVVAALARVLMQRGGDLPGPLGSMARGFQNLDNRVRGFTGDIGRGIMGGLGNLGGNVMGLFDRGPAARGMGPTPSGGYVNAPYQNTGPGNPFAGMYGQGGNTNPYANPYAQQGGNPFAGGYGAPMAGGAGRGGPAGNSVGAVAAILSMPHAGAGDAIGFMRRN